MKKIIAAIGALALATGAVSAASAQEAPFTGPRVEATIGTNDVTHARDTANVVYGLNAGVDAAVGNSPLRLGVDVQTDQLFQRDRTWGVGARVGYVVSPRAELFGRVGYANYRNIDFSDRAHALDGLEAGGGVQVALTPHFYWTLEGKYYDFQDHVGTYGGATGVGLRF